MNPGDPGSALSSGPHSERRSVRNRTERKARSGRLKRAVIPAVVVIVVVAAVAVLSSPLAPGVGQWGLGQATDVSSTSTSSAGVETGAGTTVTEGGAATEAAAALLLLQQDGRVPLAVLVSADASAAVAMGLPGITLFKSEDRFALLADLVSPGAPGAPEAPTEMLGLSLGAVASVQWAALRTALASLPGGGGLPAVLDGKGADAGAVAAFVAASMGDVPTGAAGGPWWDAAPIEGGADEFRTALVSAQKAAGSKAWRGEALPGALVEYQPGAWYFEPDSQGVKDLLAGASIETTAD